MMNCIPLPQHEPIDGHLRDFISDTVPRVVVTGDPTDIEIQLTLRSN